MTLLQDCFSFEEIARRNWLFDTGRLLLQEGWRLHIDNWTRVFINVGYIAVKKTQR